MSETETVHVEASGGARAVVCDEETAVRDDPEKDYRG